MPSIPEVIPDIPDSGIPEFQAPPVVEQNPAQANIETQEEQQVPDITTLTNIQFPVLYNRVLLNILN